MASSSEIHFKVFSNWNNESLNKDYYAKYKIYKVKNQCEFFVCKHKRQEDIR